MQKLFKVLVPEKSISWKEIDIFRNLVNTKQCNIESCVHADGVNNKKENMSSINLLFLAIEKVDCSFLNAVSCPFPIVLGLKIPSHGSYLVWLWFCLTIVDSSRYEDSLLTFPFSFKLLLTEPVIRWKAKFTHNGDSVKGKVETQPFFFTGFHLQHGPLPGELVHQTWKGVYCLGLEIKFKPKPLCRCWLLFWTTDVPKVVHTSIDWVISYIQTLAVKTWGPISRGCVTSHVLGTGHRIIGGS